MKVLSIINVIMAFTFLVMLLAFLSTNDTFSINQFEPLGIVYAVWAVFYAIYSAVKWFKNS